MDNLEAILKLREEYRFFEKELGLIEKKYGRTTYVAIFGNQIIASSKDQSKLARRIQKEYPDQPVLITNVESYGRVAELSSPEIVR